MIQDIEEEIKCCHELSFWLHNANEDQKLSNFNPLAL